MHNLTKDGEFRYIVQWFNEWSELQRDDFVPVLVDYLTAEHIPIEGTGTDNNAMYMNGLVNAASAAAIHDRPMSLFQCRIKLFREWSPKWPQDFKLKLQQKIIEMDNKVGEKIIQELNSNGINTVHSNGIVLDNGSDCEDVTHESAVIRVAQSVVAATEAAIQNDMRLMADITTTATNSTLTPVEDYDDDDDGGAVQSDNIVSDNSSPIAAILTPTITANMRAEPAEPVELPTQEHVTATTTLAATAIPI